MKNYFEMVKKSGIIQYIKILEEMKRKEIFIGMLLFNSKRGERVSGAKVYLETSSEQKAVAFQKTGDSGRVTFAFLDKGVYQILLDIPRQKGKLEAKEAWQGDMKVGYHGKKKMYLLQENSGYFSVRYTSLKNLAGSNITPMYELDESRMKGRIVIAKLEVEHKYGSVTLELSAHSQYKFHKLTDKYKNDAEMSVVRKSI
jgi:hypothetical protein